jgi:hypothetical protein
MARLTPFWMPSSVARLKGQLHRHGEPLKNKTASSNQSRCQSPTHRLALGTRTQPAGESYPYSSLRGQSGVAERILCTSPSLFHFQTMQLYASSLSRIAASRKAVKNPTLEIAAEIHNMMRLNRFAGHRLPNCRAGTRHLAPATARNAEPLNALDCSRRRETA